MGYGNAKKREPLPIPSSPPYLARLANINFQARENDLREFLKQHTRGEILRVSMVVDRHSNRPRGWAFAEFQSAEDLKAVLALDGVQFMGRPFHVGVAEPRRPHRNKGFYDNNSGRGGAWWRKQF